MDTHPYDPNETPQDYVARKERAERQYRYLSAKDHAGRRKRVRKARARIKARGAYRADRG